MGKIWLISFLIIAVLTSGCTYGPKTQTQPTAANTVEIKGFAFNPETGTFEYQCNIHPSMKGKVIVT